MLVPRLHSGGVALNSSGKQSWKQCCLIAEPKGDVGCVVAPQGQSAAEESWLRSRTHPCSVHGPSTHLCSLHSATTLLVAVAACLAAGITGVSAPGSPTAVEGSAFPGLCSCCHNVVMISGRHNPDCLNEKAASDLGFLVNAQVYEGEIIES